MLIATANHVLERFKERYWSRPEDWHWLVGKLPRFDPTERVRYTDRGKDIVLLRLTADEALAVCGTSSEVIEPRVWPPPLPIIGEAVLFSLATTRLLLERHRLSSGSNRPTATTPNTCANLTSP